jgi:hypothetical protein
MRLAKPGNGHVACMPCSLCGPHCLHCRQFSSSAHSVWEEAMGDDTDAFFVSSIVSSVAFSFTFRWSLSLLWRQFVVRLTVSAQCERTVHPVPQWSLALTSCNFAGGLTAITLSSGLRARLRGSLRDFSALIRSWHKRVCGTTGQQPLQILLAYFLHSCILAMNCDWKATPNLRSV